MDAIEQLMTEHRLIEKVLGSLETFIGRQGTGEDGGRAAVREYAEFFRNFADACHHGKEEDRLFAKMIEHGFPKEQGPIAVMLMEHDEGRRCVRTLATVGAGQGPLQPGEREEVHRDAAVFISLLREHIQKEDQVLYPMALRAVPPPELDRLAEEFEAFERDVMGEGANERFHALAERLIAAWPPAGMAGAGAACGACGGQK
jgi:hemerythrin-like domain-containing protein